MKKLLSAATVGVLATLVGMAAGHLVAALLNPAASPVLAVGSTVIDLTPTPLKEWAIAQFGTKDKPILVGSVLVGTLVLASVAGVLARRTFALGALLLLVLVGLAGAAALARPAATVVDALPALAAAATGLGALAVLTGGVPSGRGSTPSGEGSNPPNPHESPDSSHSPQRRTVLVLGVAAAAMGAAGQWITTVRTRISDVVLPDPTKAAGAFPEGLEQKYDGITPLRTPNDDFYRVDTRLTTPTVGVDDWTLTIDGDVERELTFTFDELAAMELIERDITLTCVSNEVGGKYVGGARWLGVRLTDLLDQAGVGDGADQILSTDVDGMTISTPLAVATDGRDTMIAIGMNGEPLPRDHGFPARLITPGLYGFVGATKWVTKLTLTTYAEESAYWTDRDWATDAPIKISSRVDTPKPLESIDAGQTVIGGIAWAQQRGVGKVEVRIDDGEWQEAELGPEVTIDYWRQWFLPWDATSGRHDIAVRATTEDGEVQVEERMSPFPEGSSGVQQIAVIVS
jgi:DMSO/TMAO reductase YedYZ molybdopterin-dependent catalytic subunit